MIEHLENLVTALREELQHYGEMLALLDQQQELITARAAEELLQVVAAIQTQATVILSARTHRESRQRELALHLGLPEEATLAQLVQSSLAEYRPLVQALLDENNQLLLRVQTRGRQNHLLLSRSLELMQKFLTTLFPARDNGIYNERGSTKSFTAQSLYEAVG